MSHIKIIIKSLVVSVVMSLTITFMGMVLYSSGNSFEPDFDWEQVESMSYHDAEIYINENSKEMTGWEMVKTSIEFKSFLNSSFFMSIFVSFIFLLLFNIWVRNDTAT